MQAELVQPVSERIKNRKLTKREVLNQTRDGMRSNLDRVFETEQFDESPMEEEPVSEEEPVIEEDTTEISEMEPDTTVTQEPEMQEELTDEQEELAKDLSMPVDHPELMVVVPKAFDLDEYLEYQENGEELQTDDASNLKYFVIGGSFLVPRNADNFNAMLESRGYDTHVLFNTESRFNFVAYEGFADFETAVARTLEIRENINSEAWLFTLQSETEEIKN